MAFKKFADISKEDAKVVPHDDPQIKKIKEQLASAKKPKKSVTK